MPLVGWICPDNKQIGIEECQQKCRLPRRCLTKSTLLAMSKQERVFDGIPHVTDLLNGTMMSYLKIKCQYVVNPQSRAWTLLGSVHHKLLEGDGSNQLSEIAVRMVDSDGQVWMQGCVDLVEYSDLGSIVDVVMTDFKTFGGYRVQKALGLQGSKKEGWKVNPLAADLKEVELQLNAYRLMLEQEKYGMKLEDLKSEYKIDRMQIQVTVRDGGLRHCKDMGVDRNMYLIPIKRLSDNVVWDYFYAKAMQLKQALAGGEVVSCTEEERWQGRRCEKFCDVAPVCVDRIGY